MHKRSYPVCVVLVLIGILVSAAPALADEVPRMTVDELQSRLGADDVAVLDVRSGRDWQAAKTAITGSVRAAPSEVGQWAENFPKQKTYVLYCT